MRPTRIRKIPGHFYVTVVCFVFLIDVGHSQDVGSFLAGLLGSAEVPLNESESNYPPCPGECVHAITSILCSKVIDELYCGASYLRCCVAADFNFGTVVETSAPLLEDLTSSSDPPEDYGIFEEPVRQSPTPPSTTVSPSPQTSSHVNKFIIPVHRPNQDSNPIQEKKPCPGMCVESAFSRYCSSLISYGICEEGSTCCSSSSDDATEEPKISRLPDTTYSKSVTKIYHTTATVPQVTTKIITTPTRAPTTPTTTTKTTTTTTTEVPTTTTMSGPPCPGSCVAPLFSLLCDAVVSEYYCPNEGRCCISEEDFQPTTTTTEPPIPSCRGACMPALLSGLCNKPSELIIRSDCEANFICCHDPRNKDGDQANVPHRPFLRPPSQTIFSSHPQPPNHLAAGPPLRRPPLQNPYPPPQHIPIPRPPSSAVVAAPHNHLPSSIHSNPPFVSGVSSQGQSSRPQSNFHSGISGQEPPSRPHSNFHSGISGQEPPSHPQSNVHQGVSGQGQPLRPQSNLPYNPSRPLNRPFIPLSSVSHDDAKDSTNQNFPAAAIQDYNVRPLGQQHSNLPQSSSSGVPPKTDQHPASSGSSYLSEPFKVVNPHPAQSEQSHLDAHHGTAPSSQSYPHIAPQSSLAGNQPYQGSVAQGQPLDSQLRPSSSHHGAAQNSQPYSNFSPTLQARPLPPKPQPSESSEHSDSRPTVPHADNFKPEPPQDSQLRPIPSNRPLPLSPESYPHLYEHQGQRYKPVRPQQAISSQNHPTHPQLPPSVEDHHPNSDVHQPPFIPISSVAKPAAPPAVQQHPGHPNPLIPSHHRYPGSQTSADSSRPYAVKPAIFGSDASKEPPLCPGPCIASFLRFTCFGTNAVYNGFSCTKAGTMCCAPIEDIEKYEETLKIQDSFFDSRPDIDTATTKKPAASNDGNRRPDPSMCGIKGTRRRETPRVVGGRTSSPGEWCWQVALINAKNQYLCGGALIGSRWVLSAAHCITALVRNGDPIYVRVGDFDLASQFGTPGAQTQRVSTSYIHHNHNGQTLDNDIALLRLENPADLNENVCLVCLPARGALSEPGKRCTVTGYGYQSESGPISLKIREAELPIVDDMKCVEQVNNVTEKLFILPTGSFCAGGEAGHDACQGDGGGPLVCQNEGYYELMGLVSWGFGCGKEDVPGVYVKVSSFIGWINQIISVNN